MRAGSGLAVALGAFLLSGAAAEAQPLQRGDVTGLVGWFNAHKQDLSDYDQWYSRSAFGGGAAGWYWMPHLKTEVEAGATSTARLFAAREVVVDGRRLYISARYRIGTRRAALIQTYQFFDNAWIHPYVGAGIDFTSETTRLADEPLYAWDVQTGTSRVVSAGELRLTRRQRVRPVALVGAKLYTSERAFFRTDARFTLRSGVEEVILRLGFGVDF